MKCPQLSKPETAAARNQNSTVNRMQKNEIGRNQAQSGGGGCSKALCQDSKVQTDVIEMHSYIKVNLLNETLSNINMLIKTISWHIHILQVIWQQEEPSLSHQPLAPGLFSRPLISIQVSQSHHHRVPQPTVRLTHGGGWICIIFSE